MSLACYCNSHHHFRADHPVAGCLVSGCDCQAMSGGPAERAREIVETWGIALCERCNGLTPLMRREIAALAAQAAHWEEVGRTQVEAAKWLDCHPARIDLYAKRLREQYDALREALEERAATACKKTCGWSRTMVGGAIQHTPDHTPECDRARALTGAPREEPA